MQKRSQLQSCLRIHCVEVVPLILKARLGLQQLDVLDALHGLHQHRVA